MKFSLIVIFFALTFSIAFAQQPDNTSSSNSNNYELIVDDHHYLIPYHVDANVLGMNIDQESKSLLIGIQDSKDSLFTITLDSTMLSAANNEFVVLVDGVDTGYEIASNDNGTTLSFFIPEYAEEVEIIGTHAIPEFPLGLTLVFVVVITSIIVLTKSKRLAIT